MKCVRCGSEIKETDRCCLKCGAINYNHPQNKEFVENYAPEVEIEKANTSFSRKKRNLWKILLAIFLVIIIILLIEKFI